MENLLRYVILGAQNPLLRKKHGRREVHIILVKHRFLTIVILPLKIVI